MSYGIIRIQKFKKDDVRGIQSHDNRERKSLSNPDIDPAKSDLNFSLIECQNQNFSDAIRKNLEGLNSTKAIRKDAVVMVQCLVTSDHDFFKKIPEPDKQRKFFEQSLAFIADRYGRQNIISATVHLDEKTPHMHVNLTPIRGGKLSAKSIFDRNELRNLHTDFHRSVGKAWGLERGESREEKRRHLDTEAFKIATSQANLKQAELAEKEQQGRVMFYQTQADEAEKVLQEDFEIPQGLLNRKAALARSLEVIELQKKALAAKHFVETENKGLRFKVKTLSDQVSSLESESKKSLASIQNLTRTNTNLVNRIEETEKFFRWDLDAKNSFAAWQKEQTQAAARERERRTREFESLKQDLEQKKLQKEKPPVQEKPAPAVTPDQAQAQDKERQRVDAAFSVALRNTPGTAGQHMGQAKKLLEQWEKAPDREAFERWTVEGLQDQAPQKGPSR